MVFFLHAPLTISVKKYADTQNAYLITINLMAYEKSLARVQDERSEFSQSFKAFAVHTFPLNNGG